MKSQATDSGSIAVQFCKAQASSLLATVADFGVTVFCMHCFGIYYVWATFIGAISGGVTNCLVNYRWTFRGCGRGKTSVALRYMLVWIGSILLNTWGTAYGVSLVEGWHPEGMDVVLLVKAVVALLVGVLWNFLMQKYYVYKAAGC